MEMAEWGRAEISRDDDWINNHFCTRAVLWEKSHQLFSLVVIKSIMWCCVDPNPIQVVSALQLDPNHSCAKLTAAAEGQKQLTPEPCSLKPSPPLMHIYVLEHPTATPELRLWLVPSYQVIKIKKSSVTRHSHSKNMSPLQSKVNLAFQWHAHHQSLQEDFSV